MMAWIESHDELPTHPKTGKLARRLGVEAPQAVGHLHFLWWWCITHRPDGILHDMDADDIAFAAGWSGDPVAFVDALFTAGWLDDNGESLSVHDWWEGAGKTIKRRKFATERQRKARDQSTPDVESHDSNADVTRDTHASHSADSDSDRDRDNNQGQEISTSAVADPNVSQEARQLTREFALKVRENEHPVPKASSKAADTWLIEMDRLLRIGPKGWDGDPPTVDEVRQVIGWVTEDSFEKANVLSVPKLRDRYSQLRLKALNTGPSRASPASKGSQYATKYREAAAELERQGR